MRQASLHFSPQDERRQVPGDETKQIEQTCDRDGVTEEFVVGSVEHARRADETQYDHEEIHVGIEEGELGLDYIAGGQHLSYLWFTLKGRVSLTRDLSSSLSQDLIIHYPVIFLM